MNFLAHLYLSQSPPELMVGNFIGDFVKGKAFENFPDVIRKGIILHREIDAFTDDHVWVKKSKKRLVPKYRHYAAVIVDIFYDHFLASQWHSYHHQPLEIFTSGAYHTIQDHWHLLPEKAKYMLPFMVEQNWLLNYSSISGIKRSLTGLSRRSKFTSHMEEATEDLEKYYDIYKEEFTAFFPVIIEYVEMWKKKNIKL